MKEGVAGIRKQEFVVLPMDNKLVRREVRIQEGQDMKRHCPQMPWRPSVVEG